MSSCARESLTVSGPQVTIQDGVYKDDRETFVVMFSTVSMKTISSVSSFSAITVYKGTHNKNNKPCNALSTERYTPSSCTAGMLQHIISITGQV